jgi:glycosyltransferase involved in cell wall biosynthesis
VKRLLLVTHRSIEQEGGPAVRWRAFARYLPEHGWQVEVVNAREGLGASEFDASASRAVSARAAIMARVGAITEPAFRMAGVRPDVLPLSMLWIPRGAWRVRRHFATTRPDVVLATGPPMAGPLAARLGLPEPAPLVVELRDLWAGSPAFDAGGPALPAIEHWLLGGARRIVACTPEAVVDLRARHSDLADRVVEIPNGFDPAVREFVDGQAPRPPSVGVVTLLHSGTLTPARPLTPLLRALNDRRVNGDFRLVLHGHLSPASREEVATGRAEGTVPIEVVAPSAWKDAVRRIAAADACLITQATGAGDATAVASKVYEYLALRKPVVCLTDGGATEALLRRLDAAQLCARLSDVEGIVQALLRVRDGIRPTVPDGQLEHYSRRKLARRMAELLDEVSVWRQTNGRGFDEIASD